MGETGSIQIPPGDYDYELITSSPDIFGEQGDATFRRFKAYDLIIHTEHGDDPGWKHLGD